jgi:type I restriction enzyme S subunit
MMSEKNDIPKHWQVKYLGEVCNVLDNLRKPINSSERQQRISGKSNNELFPYYGATGQVGWIDSFITDGEYILVGEDGAPFLDLFKDKAYKIKGKTWVNNHAHILNGKENILLNDFILYYLNSINYREFVNGTTRLKLTQSNLVGIPVVLPPLPEQQAIVSKIEELFSDLENGKQQLQTAGQQLKIYRQSLLKWAFEGKLTNKNVKDGEMPKGWKWVKLGDVSLNVEYGSATKSKETGKIPVLRMGNIQKGRFVWDDLVYTDDEDEISKYLLNKNDILFNRTNSAELVGKTAIYKGERPAIFAGYLIRINRIETLIDAEYLTYYLNTHAAKQYGNTIRSFGVNQSNINGTKLKTYPIPLPPLNEQQLIVSELESKLTVCDKIEETISQSLQQAETLRQSILKKAFEGKL